MAGYEVKIIELQVGERAYRLEALKDKLQYDDPDGVAEAAGVPESSWPIFGQLWPSGRVLAELLAGRALEGRRVLEVGCGLGLASMVAARAGARVLACDQHPLAADFLARNAALNGLGPIPFEVRDWADEGCVESVYELIVGSDVLYESEHPGLLAGFIERHAAPDVEVIIVDPGRGNHNRFLREMAARGFDGELERPQGLVFDGELFKGQVLRLGRAQGAAPGPSPRG